MKKVITWIMVVMMTLSLGVFVSAEEEAMPLLIATMTTQHMVNEMVQFNDVDIKSDAIVQVVDGKVMVPLRSIAEIMGYTVTWNAETRSIEINQGAQWTSITVGNNAYFKNKMAAHELSSAPMIINNRTLVPVEFFADILSKSCIIENNQIKFSDMEAIIHSGYVKDILIDEKGMKTLTLSSDMTSDSIELQTIIHTTQETTFFQKEVKVGDFVQVVSSQIMTMSLPGQTSGYIVY